MAAKPEDPQPMAAKPENPQPAGTAGTAGEVGGRKQELWFVDGKAYDFTDFMGKHPGGSQWFAFPDKDLSVSFHTYHKDPQKLLPILEKYRVEGAAAKQDAHILSEAAQFLLRADFDPERDLPTYDFDPANKELLLNDCRARVLRPEVQAKVKELDRGFDLATGSIVAAYLAFLVAWLGGGVPWYLAAPVFAALRTALSGAGHYMVHRKKPYLADGLFDFNYVGSCLTGVHGHSRLHHSYSVTEADPKAGFFGGMMAVPRLWRVPVFTLHKLGHFFTGMLGRGLYIHTIDSMGPRRWLHLRRPDGGPVVPLVAWPFFLARLFLVLEFVLAVLQGLHYSWFAQFLLTLWVNTFLVVSSHDFEEQQIQLKGSKDWGRYQVANTLDLEITGNPWVDCFLSAGLSPHRAHHILPYQRSGWANVYCTQFVRASAEKCGLPWEPPRSFQGERMPAIVRAYLLAPVADPVTRQPRYDSILTEHLSLRAYWDTLQFAAAGFVGNGSM